MTISKEKFIDINKCMLIGAILMYLVGVFSPLKYLNAGLLFAMGVGFFCLLHADYFAPRLRQAAHLWMFPALMCVITLQVPLSNPAGRNNFLLWTLSLLVALIPALMFMLGTAEAKPKKKERLPVITVRIAVQVTLFMAWAAVTAVAYVKGTRPDLFYWAMFHVSTVAILPFLFGRVICSWICPNATLQDGLLKFLKYKRPITLHKSIEAQSNTCAMNISGDSDKRAPLMPATLLLCWFPVFFTETIFDLTQQKWWPLIFMYGLMFFSLLMPWRKLCTYFCFLSSYRGLAGNNSLWRIRFNKDNCRRCKRCLAEEACPFYINIRDQDSEMPTTCCVCFSCMEACPFDDVITTRRPPKQDAAPVQESAHARPPG